MKLTKIKTRQNLVLVQALPNICVENLNWYNTFGTHTLSLLILFWKFTLNTLSHICVFIFNIKQYITDIMQTKQVTIMRE